MKQLIWDLPTRLAHWGFVLSVLLAYFIPPEVGSGSVLSGLHVVCGVIAGLLLVWRLVWGCVGSKHARFRSLLFSVTEVKRYILSAVRGKGAYFAGHNPGGAMVIWALFALLAATLISGVLGTSGGRGWGEIHEVAPNILVAMIALHIVGVLLATSRHKENYLGSMFSGLKNGQPDEAIPQSHPVAAMVLTTWVILGTSYFVAGFDSATGVFSPPGTSLSVQLIEPEHERRPRQFRKASRESAEDDDRSWKTMLGSQLRQPARIDTTTTHREPTRWIEKQTLIVFL